jgi:tetratricopeptide (TPR) repeat protein
MTGFVDVIYHNNNRGYMKKSKKKFKLEPLSTEQLLDLEDLFKKRPQSSSYPGFWQMFYVGATFGLFLGSANAANPSKIPSPTKISSEFEELAKKSLPELDLQIFEKIKTNIATIEKYDKSPDRRPLPPYLAYGYRCGLEDAESCMRYGLQTYISHVPQYKNKSKKEELIEGALSFMEEAISLNPKSALYRVMLSLTLFDLGREDEAYQLLIEASKLNRQAAAIASLVNYETPQELIKQYSEITALLDPNKNIYFKSTAVDAGIEILSQKYNQLIEKSKKEPINVMRQELI